MDHRKLIDFYHMIDIFVMPLIGKALGMYLLAAMCGIL